METIIVHNKKEKNKLLNLLRNMLACFKAAKLN